MKKLVSMIAAFSVLASATAGLSVQAAEFKFKSTGFSAGASVRLMEAGSGAAATPTADPAATHTAAPTGTPAVSSAAAPTASPAAAPTAAATQAPAETPTAAPTAAPTEAPTAAPTEKPTAAPTPTAEAPAVQGLTLNKQILTLKVGETFILNAETEPEEAPDEQVVWSTTNNCVTIAEDGTVTAVEEGATVVSATALNSKYVASCYIEVANESGMLNLNVSKGVKEVIVTRNGKSTEVNAGSNELEAGVYSVTARSEEGYALNAYEETVTVNKGEVTTITISAEKTMCTVTLPLTEGITITPVNGSESPVETGGSYSFTVTVSDGYNADSLVVKQDGNPITAVDGVYTLSGITDDVIITIEGAAANEGAAAKSDDASLKSVTVNNIAAVPGENDSYSVTIPYGETASTNNIVIETNDDQAVYDVTTADGVYVITVKAEDGTTRVYKLSIVTAEATAIDQFKLAITNLNFSDVTQSSTGSYESQAAAKAEIETKIAGIAGSYQGVTYTVENGEYAAPVAGTLSAPTGTDGYYKFNVKLSDGTLTRIIEINIKINAYNYAISSTNITATATSITVRNLDGGAEVALYDSNNTTVIRNWTRPVNGAVTFSNLDPYTTYSVAVRAAGTSDYVVTGTTVTTLASQTSGRVTKKYYKVTFDEGDHGKISSGKSTQTVKLANAPVWPVVTPNEGYIFKGWSSNGVLIENPDSVMIRCATAYTAIYEKSSGSAYGTNSSKTSSTTPSTVQDISTPVVPTFYDVPSTSWYYSSITNVCSKGYMNGTDGGRFEPEATLTRGMLVTILYRYACEPEINEAPMFSDVPSGTWYSDAVAWAADAGIVNGITADSFAPDANITREQLATIIYRYSDAFGYDISAAGNIIKYSDSSYISDWAQTALIWTTGAGIIDGKDGNTLDPLGNATRAEAATIIERFDNYINS